MLLLYCIQYSDQIQYVISYRCDPQIYCHPRKEPKHMDHSVYSIPAGTMYNVQLLEFILMRLKDPEKTIPFFGNSEEGERGGGRELWQFPYCETKQWLISCKGNFRAPASSPFPKWEILFGRFDELSIVSKLIPPVVQFENKPNHIHVLDRCTEMKLTNRIQWKFTNS